MASVRRIGFLDVGFLLFLHCDCHWFIKGYLLTYCCLLQFTKFHQNL